MSIILFGTNNRDNPMQFFIQIQNTSSVNQKFNNVVLSSNIKEESIRVIFLIIYSFNFFNIKIKAI